LKETSSKLSRVQKYTDPQMRGTNIKIDLTLETLLSQPAQHGPKVVLLLKELLKYYSGEDGKTMNTAINTLEETIKRVSNSLKEKRNKEKVEYLKQTLTNISTFNMNNRKFLEENKVKQVLAQNTLEIVDKIAYLFEDIILICENNQITSALTFNNLLVMNVPDFPYLEQNGIKYAVQFCTFDPLRGSFHFIFCFESELIKNRWMELILKIKKEKTQKVGSLISRNASIFSLFVDSSSSNSSPKKDENSKSKNLFGLKKKKKSKIN